MILIGLFRNPEGEKRAPVENTASRLCRRHKAFRQYSEPITREMARDEARHGKAFEGLLNRYFGK